MAGMNFIDDARTVLEEDVMELNLLVKSFNDLAGENDPEWLWFFTRLASRIDASAQAYMMAVHEHARPVLNSLSAGVQPARIEPGEADA